MVLNSFVYNFSLFLSFTEILIDTFDSLGLCSFSLTDLFLCVGETEKQQQQRGFLFFRRQVVGKETFLKHGKHDLTPSSKAAPETRKQRLNSSLSRKTLDFQDHNDVNDCVKSTILITACVQSCSVHHAVKKYMLSRPSYHLPTIPIALYEPSNVFKNTVKRRNIFALGNLYYQLSAIP